MYTINTTYCIFKICSLHTNCRPRTCVANEGSSGFAEIEISFQLSLLSCRHLCLHGANQMDHAVWVAKQYPSNAFLTTDFAFHHYSIETITHIFLFLFGFLMPILEHWNPQSMLLLKYVSKALLKLKIRYTVNFCKSMYSYSMSDLSFNALKAKSNKNLFSSQGRLFSCQFSWLGVFLLWSFWYYSVYTPFR